MARYFEFLFMIVIALTLLRWAILVVGVVVQRSHLRKKFGWNAEKTVETQLDHWRTKTGRALWLNLVGIPILIFFALIFISRNG